MSLSFSFGATIVNSFCKVSEVGRISLGCSGDVGDRLGLLKLVSEVNIGESLLLSDLRYWLFQSYQSKDAKVICVNTSRDLTDFSKSSCNLETRCNGVSVLFRGLVFISKPFDPFIV